MVPTVTGRIYEAKEARRCSPQHDREDRREHNLHHKCASVLGRGQSATAWVPKLALSR